MALLGGDQRQREGTRTRTAPAYAATYNRTGGARHLFAAYDLGRDRLYGHVRPRKTRTRFLEFCRYVRSLYPREIRMAIVCDKLSPHLTTRRDQRVGAWAGEQRRGHLYPDQQFLAEPDRGPVHSLALLRSRRH